MVGGKTGKGKARKSRTTYMSFLYPHLLLILNDTLHELDQENIFKEKLSTFFARKKTKASKSLSGTLGQIFHIV